MGTIYDKAKKVIKENKDMFDRLEELDRTGKLRKISYKKRVNFTIDENLFNRFRSHCKKNCINMSAKVESLIRKELSNH
jgi:hypothetical protein